MQGCRIQPGREATRLAIVVVSAAALFAGSAAAYAQSRVRGAINVASPGRIARLGQNSPTQVFNTYSYGLGAVGQASAPAENVLRTSISRRASFTISRTGGGASLPKAPAVAAKATGSAIYQPLNMQVHVSRGHSFAALSSAMSGASALGAESYLQAIGAASTALSAGDEPITSLVPSRPGKYGNIIARGEELLRAGRHAEAFDTFKRASYMNRRDPAILLSMSHAEFGMANFPMATYYLQKAIRFLPELPSVPLRPDGFFADKRLFRYNMTRLRDRIRERPTEAGSYLLMAYLLWFQDEPDIKGVQQTLSLGLSAATEPELVDAFEIFRDAVDAVSADDSLGELAGPMTQPTVRVSGKGNSPEEAEQATSPSGTPAEE